MNDNFVNQIKRLSRSTIEPPKVISVEEVNEMKKMNDDSPILYTSFDKKNSTFITDLPEDKNLDVQNGPLETKNEQNQEDELLDTSNISIDEIQLNTEEIPEDLNTEEVIIKIE